MLFNSINHRLSYFVSVCKSIFPIIQNTEVPNKFLTAKQHSSSYILKPECYFYPKSIASNHLFAITELPIIEGTEKLPEQLP